MGWDALSVHGWIVYGPFESSRYMYGYALKLYWEFDGLTATVGRQQPMWNRLDLADSIPINKAPLIRLLIDLILTVVYYTTQEKVKVLNR